MNKSIDLSNYKKTNTVWALTMTFDAKDVNNLKNSIMIDDVEKKLLKMVEYSDAKDILKKLQLESKS